MQRIRVQFGGEVAGIVAACSDSIDADGPRTWRERKAGYLSHLPEVTDEAILRVVLADKVHNARSIVRDYRAEGEAMWARFTNKTIDDQLHCYPALLAFLPPATQGPGRRPAARGRRARGAQSRRRSEVASGRARASPFRRPKADR